MSKIYLADKKTLDEINNKIDKLSQKENNRCKVFDTAGTYTWNVPEGIELVYITATGAGGGGLAGYYESGNIHYCDNDIENNNGMGKTGGVTSFGNLLTVEGGCGAKNGEDRKEKEKACGYGGKCNIPIFGHNGKDGCYFETDNSKYISTNEDDVNYVLSFKNNSDFGTLFNNAGGGGIGGIDLPRYSSSGATYFCYGGSGAYVIDCPVIIKDKSKITITVGKGGNGGVSRYNTNETQKKVFNGHSGNDGLLIVRW